MGGVFNAHIFGRRQRGDREEVRMKLFDEDDNPVNLGGQSGQNHKTITIPHEQIISLWEEGVILLEPTEVLDYNGPPTELPFPISCEVLGIGGGGPAYGNQVGGQTLALAWGQSDIVAGLSLADYASTPSSEYVLGFSPPYDSRIIRSASFPSLATTIGSSDFNGGLTHNGLTLWLQNVSGELTGGHPDHKLLVFLTYFVAKLS